MCIRDRVGLMLGYAIPGLIVDTSELNTRETERQVMKLNMILFSICLFSFILVVLLFRSKPPTPPSISAQRETMNVSDSFKESIKNKEYLLHLCAFALNDATYAGFSGVLSQLIRPFGYGDTEAGFIGVLLNLAGLLGTIVVIPLAKSPKHLKFGVVLMGLSIAGGFVVLQKAITLEWDDFMVQGAVVIIGLCFGGIWPMSAELAAEVNYPIREDISFGAMGALSNLLGIIQFSLLSIFLESNDCDGSSRALYVILVFLTISFILFIVNKYPARRLKAETTISTSKNTHHVAA
eukprot:TRINITY_DN7239_c0_g1_i1.p1 TRINITY_DN7239_c0_g1~~TRINITY_DN7239_c0_g1_i1.p1  ORF type:complete len:293 (-),score=54.44 TRINITY_DN7239_c0_g1_i1:38-916(-)